MDNPETLATLGSQDTGQRVELTKGTIKNRKPRNWQHWVHKSQDKGYRKPKDNQEWTTQRHWQHWVHKTQDKG